MQNALVFLISTLVNLYLVALLLRILLQRQRVDFSNPLVQFVITVTNPLVIPVRRYVPPIYGIDTASVLVALVIKTLSLWLLLSMICIANPDAMQLIGTAVLGLVRLTLNLYFFLILAYVILSWVSTGGYNPAAALLNGVVEPLLAPFRRWIPSIGGLDLSPLIAIIAIQFIMLLMPSAQSLIPGALCSAIGGLI